MSAGNALRAHAGRLHAYRARSVLVADCRGAVRGNGSEGFHHRNTRFLSRFELRADGRVIEPFSAGPVGSDRILGYGAIAWTEAQTDASGEPELAVYAEIDHQVSDALRTELRFNAHHPTESASFELRLSLAADFADTEEAERGERRQTAPVDVAWSQEERELLFRYCHDRLDLASAVRIEEAPGPVSWSGDEIVVPIALSVRGHARVVVVVEPVVNGERLRPTRDGGSTDTAAARRANRELSAEAPRLVTTNATVARAWETAVSDLASLPLGIEPGPATPIAGLPLYQQFFGRDALTIGWQSLLAMRALARDALRLNAAWQGTRIDDWLDEEPGKMIHQARWGPLSALGINPYVRYYGDYATVPDFLILLGQYLSWTGDAATVRGLLPAARAGLEWLERYADLDRDGFVEYVTRSEAGVKNQGWLDSGDAIVDVDGRIVDNPIATSELQAYVYAGLGQAALAFATLGDIAFAAELVSRANALRRRFHRAFWMREESTYAVALGPDKRAVRSVASNAGHLLAAGIAPPKVGRLVARRLMEPDMFSGWGIRTLSARHAAYDPFSYHRGSVWPVEQGTIGFGFARYGCWTELHRLAEAVFDATELFVAHRLPEVLGGIERDAEHGHPGVYPTSHEPQGWSASTIVLLVQAMLGVRAFAPLHLLLVDPHLPTWLPDVRFEGLRVGTATIDIGFRRRRDGSTSVEVTSRRGRLIVSRQPVPDVSGSPRARAGAALHRVLPFLA